MATIRERATQAFDKIKQKQPDAIQLGTVRRETVSGGGPTDTSAGSVSSSDTPARMAVFEISEKRIDGVNIIAGDYQVIVEAVDVEVTVEDRIICDRGDLAIKKLGRVASGGETALYDMVCRG